MKLLQRFGLLALLAAGLVVVAAPSIGSAAGDLPWQTGIRAVGNGATIEPAVNDVTGGQTFLITPNHSPFYGGSGTLSPSFNVASAPLYLVTYPIGSTADAAAPFNCYTEGAFDSSLPYNCDHAQIPGVKGHDHLVGVPGFQKAGGDYNVQWHVLATFFTPQGVQDGVSNTRILTLAQLTAAQTAGDVTGFVDTHIYFNCSAVAGAVYMGGTPLSFPPLG
jgi:hypothetical protein